MSKLSAIMDIGKRSMANSQTALQTVSHNIANKTTDGYSRQRVELVSNNPITVGHVQLGMGAKAAQVTRINNPWLEKQIQREGMNMGYLDARADSLARVEQVYNEQMNKGLNQYVNDFFNGFRELSNNPESLASRTIVKESAVAMVNDFKRVVNQLESVQEDINNQIKTTTDEINQLSKEIADLNQRILHVENQGIKANDERDRREVVLKQMAEKIEITYAEGSDGQISVTAGSTAILVSGADAATLKARHTNERNRVEIYYQAGEEKSYVNITNQLKGGRLGGVLEVRDQVIEDLLEKVDSLAFQVASEVNKAHIEGFDRNGKQGVLFFDMPMGQRGAASLIGLNKTIAQDVSRIAAGSKPNAPGDNTVANIISGLQYKKTMDGGSATFDDYYNTQVGQIGTIAQRAVKSQESQKNVIHQLTNIRESISGVSLDEETTKMLEYQKLYEASARMIRTADEMLETVLNIKR